MLVPFISQIAAWPFAFCHKISEWPATTVIDRDPSSASSNVNSNGSDILWQNTSGQAAIWETNGIVTTMRLKLHRLPSVRAGMLLYPFAEAKATTSEVSRFRLSHAPRAWSPASRIHVRSAKAT